MTARRVVLLCGPPGAGKTTTARQLAQLEGLEVYDRDDPQWPSERPFVIALARLAADRSARAVVIRSGATRDRRLAAVQLCGATDVQVLTPSAELCRARVRERARHDWRASLAGIGKWFAEYEQDGQQPPPAELVGRVSPSREW